ncbi:VOC family protein [Flavobacterium sp.]|uniref:VOC family protein n=1 Tax=Flavobacterium sp. TaxID=239 RepID=UPI0028BD4381|nr:VOC family protein [Flavobacterium sp.]
MASVHPYLTFNGTCEEAFNFYKSVFGGDFPYAGKFSEMPSEYPIAEADKNKIMHISLPIGNTVLMGSDAVEGFGGIPKLGDNFSISINADTEDEATRIFNGLSVGGKVTMPLNKTFWGAYFGMFTDKFGINWMVNYDYNQK